MPAWSPERCANCCLVVLVDAISSHTEAADQAEGVALYMKQQHSHQCPVVRAILQHYTRYCTKRPHALDCIGIGAAGTKIKPHNLHTKSNLMIKQQIRHDILL